MRCYSGFATEGIEQRRTFILSFDERKYIIDKMLEVNQMKGMKDTENKKFLATLAMCGVAAVTVVTGTLAAVLGANTQIASKDDDEFET